MNVLITGVAGFTACHLIRRLSSERDLHLFGIDICTSLPPGTFLEDYSRVDITNYIQVIAMMKKYRPDWIFNLAGLTQGSGPDLYGINMMGSIHLIEAVRLTVPECRILLVGSAAEYGIHSQSEMPITENTVCKPVNAYGISKYAMTMAGLEYVRRFKMKIVIARPFNLIGAGMPPAQVVGQVLHRIKDVIGEPEPTIAIGNLDNQRDFIAIEDVVEVYVHMIQAEAWGEVFNICSGQSHTVRSIVETLLSFSRKPIRLVTDPELVRHTDIPLIVGSTEKVKRSFGLEPSIDLNRTLRAAWDYIIP